MRSSDSEEAPSHEPQGWMATRRVLEGIAELQRPGFRRPGWGIAALLVAGVMLASFFLYRAKGETPTPSGTVTDADREAVEAFRDQARQAFASGNLRGVVYLLTEAIQRTPGDAELFFDRANARRDLGDLQGSLSDFDEALRLQPGYARAMTNRGVVRRKLGDLEGARADYDAALRLDPRDPVTYHNRALLREASDDRPGAEADLGMALEVAPPEWPHRASVEESLAELQAK